MKPMKTHKKNQNGTAAHKEQEQVADMTIIIGAISGRPDLVAVRVECDVDPDPFAIAGVLDVAKNKILSSRPRVQPAGKILKPAPGLNLHKG